MERHLELSPQKIAAWSFERHSILESTQLRAKELGKLGNRKVVVVADRQTAGKGRRNRRWESPPNCGLYFSLVFRPLIPVAQLPLVGLVAALAVKQAVQNTTKTVLEVKWPNDLLKSEKKVCGILSESVFLGSNLDFCVTGIGLNLTSHLPPPSELTDKVGGVFELPPPPDTADALIEGTVQYFAERLSALERQGKEAFLSEYQSQCASVGRTVRVETDSEIFSGLCVGIGQNGELLLELSKGNVRAFDVGDVTHAKLTE